jgi:hypothetical protein
VDAVRGHIVEVRGEGSGGMHDAGVRLHHHRVFRTLRVFTNAMIPDLYTLRST